MAAAGVIGATVVDVRVAQVATPMAKEGDAKTPAERLADPGSLSARAYPPSASPSFSPLIQVSWTPAAGTSGYHVELFRGTSRIFVSDTKRAQVLIPATWDLDGRDYRLEPDDRMYVWPVASGQRGPQAIVDARLVLDIL
jgi:hypothetical protein